jgi:A/G-specific adenine glycosylase
LKTSFLAQKIIKWYRLHKRDLPWRHTSDPYKIWLSEIILQQTRVGQGLPYYLKFIVEFPTINDLANASEQEVLRLWQGLGYYSRARNLHHTAKVICAELNGIFPANYIDLLKLKGVGSYTAAAIASFAYNEAVAVVDGNVFRVLSRIFGIETDIASHQAKKEFFGVATDLMPPSQASEFNQAMMEFGAIQCQPVSPDCLLCPLQIECVAFQTGRVGVLPIKSKKTKIRERFFNYIVFKFEDAIAMHQRTDRDIWQGLYDFKLIESEHIVDNFNELLENVNLSFFLPVSPCIVEKSSHIYTHILTHQRIQAKFWTVELTEKIDLSGLDLQFYTFAEFENLPKPVLITNFWNDNNFL